MSNTCGRHTLRLINDPRPVRTAIVQLSRSHSRSQGIINFCISWLLIGESDGLAFRRVKHEYQKNRITVPDYANFKFIFIVIASFSIFNIRGIICIFMPSQVLQLFFYSTNKVADSEQIS